MGSVQPVAESSLQEEVKKSLGYEDPLLLVSRTERLWAIEGDEQVIEVLKFCKADPAVIITPSFEHCSELQQRLSNEQARLLSEASLVEIVHSVDHKL